MPVLIPMLAIAGAALLIGALVRGHQAAKEYERFRDANGWSFDELAESSIRAFDRNGDRVLATPAGQGYAQLDESLRTSTSSRQYSPTAPIVVTTDVISVQRLVSLADRLGNGDGHANLEEVTRAYASFDRDANGRLSRAELATARAAVGETVVRREVTTVHPKQPPRPTPPR